MRPMKIKILLADDHKIVREGLSTLIEKQSDMEVMAEVDNGRAAVHFAQKLSPDVVIMDIGMPGLNGIEATRQICRELPGTKVIALSMHADKRFVIEMLNAGAEGYLLKSSAFEELVHAVHAVMAQKSYVSSPLAGILVKYSRRPLPKKEFSVFFILTRREREVLQLVAEGNCTKEIADHLHVSVKTIETHRLQIMKKLEIFSIAELTKFAIREGLTSVNV
jgi:DNA-binding NarL/FixJ family response regulator